MKKGQIFEGIIEKVEFPNKGKVYVPEEDRYVIVKNGIPGQKVKFIVNKFKSGNAEGRLLEVLVAFSRHAVDACIRQCLMKIRCR